MTQDLLGDLQPGRLVHPLRQPVPEHVRLHPHTQPVGQVPQCGLEGAIPQRFPGTAAMSHPGGVGRLVAAFLRQVAVICRPEVAGDRHPVLAPGALDSHYTIAFSGPFRIG